MLLERTRALFLDPVSKHVLLKDLLIFLLFSGVYMNNTSMKIRICLVVKLDVRPYSTQLHLKKYWCRTEGIK